MRTKGERSSYGADTHTFCCARFRGAADLVTQDLTLEENTAEGREKVTIVEGVEGKDVMVKKKGNVCRSSEGRILTVWSYLYDIASPF